MKRTLCSSLTPFLLIVILVISCAAFGQTTAPAMPPSLFPDNSLEDESADVDDSAPVARVARLSFLEGDVSFLRAGVTEWAPAVENLPLLAGDQLYAGPGARAEVQLGRGNYIRLSEGTELTIAALSDSSAQFEITEGTALIRLERLATAFRRFEVDTPSTAVLIQQDGLYRIEVRGEKDTAVSVRRGQAEVSTDEGSFKVREGHRLMVADSSGDRLAIAFDTTRDDWDQWSHDRDTTIARMSADAAPDYVTNYETNYNEFFGVSDLSSYGTWTNYSSYGQCWIPRVGSNWAPYRSGQWLWIPAAGWTWLSSEPWGWAPYHYGRWAYLSGLGWAWIPGFGSGYRGYGYRDYHWRPALVFFFNSPTPRGNYVGWYPLGPGERWRRHDHRRGDDNARLPYLGARDGGRKPGDGRLGIGPPRKHPGMSILPADGFTRGDRSVRPGAPGREMSDWINKGARAGLPQIAPVPVAVAPALDENDRRKSHRIAVPSSEIIRRSVVTRNKEANSLARPGDARERRLISTPNSLAITGGLASIESGSERSADRRPRRPAPEGGSLPDSVSERRKMRIQLPAPSEKTSDDRSAHSRKPVPEGDSAAERPAQNSFGSTEGTPREKRRTRPESPAAAAPSQSAPSGGQSDNETRSRERKHSNAGPKPNEETRQRTRAEEPGGPRDNGASTQRTEPARERPNAENRDQARQEHRQEKQERQQQQQEPRKKP